MEYNACLFSKVSDIDHMAAEKESGVSQSASHLQFWGQDSKLIFRSEKCHEHFCSRFPYRSEIAVDIELKMNM